MPNELGLVRFQILRDRKPSVVVAIATGKNYDADLHRSKEVCELRLDAAYGRSSFLPTGTPFLDGRLPIALFESRENDGGNKLFLAMVIKFDYEVIVVAGEHRAKAESAVFDLRSLSVCRFICQGKKFLLHHCNN